MSYFALVRWHFSPSLIQRRVPPIWGFSVLVPALMFVRALSNIHGQGRRGIKGLIRELPLSGNCRSRDRITNIDPLSSSPLLFQQNSTRTLYPPTPSSHQMQLDDILYFYHVITPFNFITSPTCFRQQYTARAYTNCHRAMNFRSLFYHVYSTIKDSQFLRSSRKLDIFTKKFSVCTCVISNNLSIVQFTIWSILRDIYIYFFSSFQLLELFSLDRLNRIALRSVAC